MRLGHPWTEKMVRKRVHDGRLPAMKPRGRNWYFPNASTDAAIARLKAEAKNVSLTVGDADAVALQMLRDGRSESDVVMELRLPLEHVQKLARSVDRASGPQLAKAMPSEVARASADDSRYWNDWIARSQKRMRAGGE